MSPLHRFFIDFQDVANWFQNLVNKLFNIIIRKNDWNFLFYTAMLPAFLMLCFDIIMSIICSIRLRELRFFNVLSPRSWALFRSSSASVANHVRDGGLRYSRFSARGIKLFTKLGIIKPKTNTVFKFDKNGNYVVGNLPAYGSPEWHRQHNDFLKKYPTAAEYEGVRLNYNLSDAERRLMSKKHPSINIEADDIE